MKKYLLLTVLIGLLCAPYNVIKANIIETDEGVIIETDDGVAAIKKTEEGEAAAIKTKDLSAYASRTNEGILKEYYEDAEGTIASVQTDNARITAIENAEGKLTTIETKNGTAYCQDFPNGSLLTISKPGVEPEQTQSKKTCADRLKNGE